MASLFVLLQHASLLAALAVLSPVRCGSVDLSRVQDDHDYDLCLRYRVIVLTQYSTVWPKVLTGRLSVRCVRGVAESQTLMNCF